MAPKAGGSARKQAQRVDNATYITGVATQQNVGPAAGALLERITAINNTAGAAGTITVKDGTNTIAVITVPAGQSAPPQEFQVGITGQLTITPSATTMSCLVCWD